MAKLLIPVPKAGIEIEYDTDTIDEGVFAEALFLGLKALQSRGQEKFTKNLYPNAEELKAVAKAHAEEIHSQLMAGEFRSSRRAKTSELTGAVRVEAMRLARAYVKDGIKREGGKVGHYEAKEITAYAKAMLEDPEAGPVIVTEAKENLEKQANLKTGFSVKGIKPSEKKVAEAEAKKKADKAKRDAAKAAKEAAAGGAKTKSKPAPKMPAGVVAPKTGKPATHVTH